MKPRGCSRRVSTVRSASARPGRPARDVSASHPWGPTVSATFFTSITADALRHRIAGRICGYRYERDALVDVA
jgi:hypothetical protein